MARLVVVRAYVFVYPLITRIRYLGEHLLASVPPYRLAAFQGLLWERGFYADKDCFSHGYIGVVRRATVA